MKKIPLFINSKNKLYIKVAFWHRAAIQLLFEKWSTLDWIMSNTKNINKNIPTTIAKYTAMQSCITENAKSDHQKGKWFLFTLDFICDFIFVFCNIVICFIFAILF